LESWYYPSGRKQGLGPRISDFVAQRFLDPFPSHVLQTQPLLSAIFSGPLERLKFKGLETFGATALCRRALALKNLSFYMVLGVLGLKSLSFY